MCVVCNGQLKNNRIAFLLFDKWHWRRTKETKQMKNSINIKQQNRRRKSSVTYLSSAAWTHKLSVVVWMHTHTHGSCVHTITGRNFSAKTEWFYLYENDQNHRHFCEYLICGFFSMKNSEFLLIFCFVGPTEYTMWITCNAIRQFILVDFIF